MTNNRPRPGKDSSGKEEVRKARPGMWKRQKEKLMGRKLYETKEKVRAPWR